MKIFNDCLLLPRCIIVLNGPRFENLDLADQKTNWRDAQSDVRIAEELFSIEPTPPLPAGPTSRTITASALEEAKVITYRIYVGVREYWEGEGGGSSSIILRTAYRQPSWLTDWLAITVVWTVSRGGHIFPSNLAISYIRSVGPNDGGIAKFLTWVMVDIFIVQSEIVRLGNSYLMKTGHSKRMGLWRNFGLGVNHTFKYRTAQVSGGVWDGWYKLRQEWLFKQICGGGSITITAPLDPSLFSPSRLSLPPARTPHNTILTVNPGADHSIGWGHLPHRGIVEGGLKWDSYILALRISLVT